MSQKVQITVKMKDLDSESGDNLVFKISLEQLILTLTKSFHVMANDGKDSIRLYAANAYTTLALLLQALSNPDDTLAIVPPVVVKKKRMHSGFGKRPSDAELMRHKANRVPQKDLAKLYGVTKSAISNWYCKIKEAKAKK